MPISIGDGEISFARINAFVRAKLVDKTLQERLEPLFPKLRVECLSGDAYRYDFLEKQEPAHEYRLRIVGRDQTQELAKRSASRKSRHS
jgi:hypothetical protein